MASNVTVSELNDVQRLILDSQPMPAIRPITYVRKPTPPDDPEYDRYRDRHTAEGPALNRKDAMLRPLRQASPVAGTRPAFAPARPADSQFRSGGRTLRIPMRPWRKVSRITSPRGARRWVRVSMTGTPPKFPDTGHPHSVDSMHHDPNYHPMAVQVPPHPSLDPQPIPRSLIPRPVYRAKNIGGSGTLESRPPDVEQGLPVLTRENTDGRISSASLGRTEEAGDAMRCTETASQGQRMVRQVGVASLRVEFLSLSAELASYGSSNSEHSNDTTSISCCSSDNEGDGVDTNVLVNEETERGQKSSQSTAQDTEPPTEQPSVSPSSFSSGGSQASTTRKRSKTDEEKEEGGRKKKPLSNGLGTPDLLLASLRLACPYQAYEPWRTCFKQADGCENISRLKHHMARKHMISFRCQHCWTSCDTRQKAASHLEDKQCQPRNKPIDDCFMEPDHEPVVENTSRKASAESIWWAMFRLLIRGVEQIDDSTLKTAYSPYYRASMKPTVQWMLPPVAIPRDVLRSVQTTRWTSDSEIRSDIGQSNLTELSPQRATQGTLSAPSMDPFTSAQSFSVPLYEVTFPCPPASATATTGPSEPTADPLSSSFDSLMDLIPPPVTNPLEFTTTSLRPEGEASNLGDAPAIDMPLAARQQTQPVTKAKEPAPTHSERNHQRLMQRFELVKAENQKLRESNTAIRTELNGVEQTLEEVLATEDLSDATYDRLSKAVLSLASIMQRLC
ncbi:uncharacterized protein B0T15DRAFT_529791 [Chaetomium strumarium]|uniref:Uncharacterized protein n=1 Tax=Chaetomium strumarium TaxID=1170767 RepID=A0AAJ0GW69_9PEZI|nr:hypothetical protein B0T15DRAFT_529791 [Chaetomium strumarium]